MKMAKKNKLSTPDWILKGEEKPKIFGATKSEKQDLVGEEKPTTKKKAKKMFKIRECPKCGSDDIGVVIGEIGMWECKKCGWKGVDVKEKELDEEEFMKYLDEKGEEVA